MSYILDALKKAERERHGAKIPTLEVVHRTPSAPRRRLWPWVGAAVVLVNAAVLIWLFSPIPLPFSESSARSTATPAAPAQPQPTPSSSHTPASRWPEPEREAAPARRVEAKPGPSVALAPAAPKVELQAPTPAKAPAPPPLPIAPEKSAASTPASPVPPVASAPDRPATPPVAPSPAKPGGRGTGSLQAMPPAVREVIPNMKLQVLVYSDVPADRLVFINNQKYVEGQSIDDKVVVESITPDGAILSYQGKRFMLRQ